MRQLSIEEVEPSGAVSRVVFDDRSWLMSYGRVQNALVDAVALGMIEDCDDLLAQYVKEALEWEPLHYAARFFRRCDFGTQWLDARSRSRATLRNASSVVWLRPGRAC